MRYKVDDVADYAFEKVKNIVLGSRKIYYVYDNNDPVLSVEVNVFTCFSDAIIFRISLVIGNYYEGLYVINLDN